MPTIEKFLILLFAAITTGIIVNNPTGVKGLLEGFGAFTGETVKAFSGGQGFVRG